MTTFRFRFDVHGRALQPPSVTLPQAAKAAALHEVEPLRDAMDVIRELSGWLGENVDFGLDLELLEEREVLITPPHWNYVSKPDTVSDMTSVEDQRRAASAYVRMMEQREFILNEALSLASYASVASIAGDPASRMRDALRALPKGGTLNPLPFAMPTLAVPKGSRAGDRLWADWIRARHNAIVQATPQPNWEDVEETGWKTWKERFEIYRVRRQDFPVDATDLALRARSAGPAALFYNELTKMPLSKWTDALVAAALGSPQPSVLRVPDWVRPAIERELLQDRRTLLLIVSESVTSPTAQWLPSRKNGCLWIEQARLPELIMSLPLIPLSTRWLVAIEVSGGPDMLTLAVRRDPAGIFVLPSTAEKVTFAYLGKDRLPTETTPLVPYIDNARDVDDAISKIDSKARAARRSI